MHLGRRKIQNILSAPFFTMTHCPQKELFINVPDVASVSLPFLRSLPSAPAWVAGGQPGVKLELLPWVLTPGKLCLVGTLVKGGLQNLSSSQVCSSLLLH